MATSAWVALLSTTLASSTSSITFNSIPSGYRDLVMVIAGSASTATGLEAAFNGSTAGMSTVYAYGAGTSAASGTASNVSIIGNMDATQGVSICHFFDYSATDKHKASILRGNRGSFVITYVNNWASTDAITSIGMTCQAGSINSGTVITIWGSNII